MWLFNSLRQDIHLCSSALLPRAERLKVLFTKYAILLSPLPGRSSATLLGHAVHFSRRIEYAYFCKALQEAGQFLTYVRDVHTIVDVGANLGYFSIISAAVFPGAEILAFEPIPRICELAQRNVSPYPNITVENLAVSDREGTLRMIHDPAKPLESKIALEGDLEVRAVTLDGHLTMARVDLLKIDVEGFESLVLAGAERTLHRTRYLLTEITPGPNYTLAELQGTLRSAGFSLIAEDLKGKYRNALYENRNFVGSESALSHEKRSSASEPVRKRARLQGACAHRTFAAFPRGAGRAQGAS